MESVKHFFSHYLDSYHAIRQGGGLWEYFKEIFYFHPLWVLGVMFAVAMAVHLFIIFNTRETIVKEEKDDEKSENGQNSQSKKNKGENAR